MSHQIKLASGVTVSLCRQWVKDERKEDIANKLIERRFLERYIEPMETAPKKHGFCLMAVCCLMIESLESFRLGWPDTTGKPNPKQTGKEAFKLAFQRIPELSVFVGDCDWESFYYDVRCGILHQGETVGGWKVKRKGPLFDVASRTINASRFHRLMRKEVSRYRDELLSKDWNAPIWEKCRDKLEAICNNCTVQSSKRSRSGLKKSRAT